MKYTRKTKRKEDIENIKKKNKNIKNEDLEFKVTL